jgi:hypothetical protein
MGLVGHEFEAYQIDDRLFREPGKCLELLISRSLLRVKFGKCDRMMVHEMQYEFICEREVELNPQFYHCIHNIWWQR